MKLTISEKGHLIRNDKGNYETYIYNSDNKELSFYELYEYLQKLSTKPVSNKKFGLPRIYQCYRKSNAIDNIFLQGDATYKTNMYNILTLDYDNSTSTKEEIEQQLLNYEYITYNSFSHDVKDNNRFRILINLDSEIDISKVNKLTKDKILEIFTFGETKPDTASIKDGWMGLPALYENKRNANLSYNKGEKLNLNKIIDKINLETMITTLTKNKINENVLQTDYNNDRQISTFENIKNDLKKEFVSGNRHNALTSFISKCSYIGIEPSEIRNVIYEYETNEDKLANWFDLIDKWYKNDVISYYYRLEYKVFNSEFYLYDNVIGKYFDSINNNWLNRPPRNKMQDCIQLSKTNNFYNALANRLNNRYDLAKKLYDFINLMMAQYNPDDLIRLPQYQNLINKGVAFKASVYNIIMFNNLKFKEIDKVDTNSYVDFWDAFLSDKTDEPIDDQILMLSVLRELVWVRPQKINGLNGMFGYRYFFSPRPKLLKMLEYNYLG